MPAPLPRLLSRRTDPAGDTTLRLAMDPDLLAFQGHFPGRPILPGVIQIDWAIRFASDTWGALGSFEGLDQLKFQDLILPGSEVELTLSRTPGRLRFRYTAGEQAKSSGVVRFLEAP